MKLWTFDLSYFLGKNYFGDDGSQNMFVFKPTLDTSEWKETKSLIIFSVGNQVGYILLNLSHYILLSCFS